MVSLTIKEDIDWAWTDIFVPKNWTDVGLAFDRADPGYIIPWHTDHFANYSKRFLTLKKIYRFKAKRNQNTGSDSTIKEL